MLKVEVLTLEDSAAWHEALPAAYSVFGSYEFTQINHVHFGYEPRLFVLTVDDSRVVYPIFLRSLKSLPFVPNGSVAKWDTSTPEFTGPMQLRGVVTPSLQQAFAESFSQYCREEGIVAEFAHLHPWNSPTHLLEPSCLEFNREIVYVDLTLSEDQLWRESFTHACRKNINRSRQEHVRVFEAACQRDIEEFHRLYIGTMDRNQAQGKYYFPVGYFQGFLEKAPQHARFVLAEYKGQTIAAVLYLHDDADVYSYLGGADFNFQNARPTNAVVYDTILWAKTHGKKRLILGGGYRPNDGIFLFKASFSPLCAKFYVYKRIHSPELYARLCQEWDQHFHCEPVTDGAFPGYRNIPNSR
jgi:hypothetical protein